MSNSPVVSSLVNPQAVVKLPCNSLKFNSLRSESSRLIVALTTFVLISSQFLSAQQTSAQKLAAQSAANAPAKVDLEKSLPTNNSQTAFTGGGLFGQYVRATRELLRTHEAELPQSLAAKLKAVEAHLEISKRDRNFQFSAEQIADLKNFFHQAANIQDEFKRINRLNLRLTNLNRSMQSNSEKPDWFVELSGALDREFKTVKSDWRSEQPEFQAKILVLENKIKNFEAVVISNRELHEYVDWSENFLDRELGTTHRFTTSLQKEWDQMNSAVSEQIEMLNRPQNYDTFEAVYASNSTALYDVIGSAKGFSQKMEDPVFLHQKIREAGFEYLGAQMPSFGVGAAGFSFVVLALMAVARFYQRRLVPSQRANADRHKKPEY